MEEQYRLFISVYIAYLLYLQVGPISVHRIFVFLLNGCRNYAITNDNNNNKIVTILEYYSLQTSTCRCQLQVYIPKGNYIKLVTSYRKCA